jgi:PAS domain S-box-containing protein
MRVVATREIDATAGYDSMLNEHESGSVGIWVPSVSHPMPQLGRKQMSSNTPKFDSLLEAVPDALVGVDTAGKIRFVNHQSELLFDLERDDLIGHHIGSLVPEALWHVYLGHREVYFEDPRSRAMRLDLEVIGRRSDGAEFPVIVSLSGIDTGEVLLELAAVGEVTGKKQSLQKAQRMTAIVKHCDHAIIAKTLAGIITSWNPAAEKMYGYSSTEIIGRSIDILAPPNRVGEINAILGRIRSGQTVKHFETIRVRKDGSAIRVSITVSPIPDADGLVVDSSKVARAMTEKTKAFEGSRALNEANHDSLVCINSGGKITDANEATVAITGVPRDELIGTAFSDYFTDSRRANGILQLVFERGTAVDYPLSIRHRGGTVAEVRYNAAVDRDADGNVLGVFAAARDVTRQVQEQKKNVEQQAREREELVDLQQLLRLTVGRELKMTKLKKENEFLRGLLPEGAARSDEDQP